MADIWTTKQDNGDVVVQYIEDPMVISSPIQVISRMQVELRVCGYPDHEIVYLDRVADSGNPAWRARARVQ